MDFYVADQDRVDLPIPNHAVELSESFFKISSYISSDY